jgi:hypothetical protein
VRAAGRAGIGRRISQAVAAANLGGGHRTLDERDDGKQDQASP